MTASLVLLAYATVMATAGSWALARSDWPSRSPRWGVLAWQVLTASVVASVVLAAVAVSVPRIPLTTDLAELLRACGAALRAQYATPGGAAVSVVAAAAAAAILGRVGYCLARCLASAARARRRQRQALSLVARRDDARGALVIEHPAALAYCLPGRHRAVVLTSGALELLDDEQLSAVLAHEHAHLRGRHHLVLAAAAAAEQAFPGVPVFRQARIQTTRLVEMLADDIATRRSDRLTLATALVELADGSAPKAALGAGGDAAIVRVRRLVAPADPVGAPTMALLAVLTVGVLAAPALILAAPALAGVAADYCPLVWGSAA